jgi:hypothetical protein
LISGDADGNSFFYQVGQEKTNIELCCKNAYVTKEDLKIQSNPIKIPITSAEIRKNKHSKIHMNHWIQTSQSNPEQKNIAESITIIDFK